MSSSWEEGYREKKPFYATGMLVYYFFLGHIGGSPTRRSYRGDILSKHVLYRHAWYVLGDALPLRPASLWRHLWHPRWHPLLHTNLHAVWYSVYNISSSKESVLTIHRTGPQISVRVCVHRGVVCAGSSLYKGFLNGAGIECPKKQGP